VHWRCAPAFSKFITLMPSYAAVVLVFGDACTAAGKLFGEPILVLTPAPIPLLPVIVLSSTCTAPDTGLRYRWRLTEAALSLGAGWRVILTQVIFPNLRVAILSGVFLTFAIVMGEFTFASLLYWPAFGPYMEEIGAMRAYTPQALSMVSFLLTWGSIGLLQLVGRAAPGQQQVAGAH
jgi:putative spermidine/putrescine transport system permease protein